MALVHVVSRQPLAAGSYYFEVEIVAFDVPIYETTAVGITRDNPPISTDNGAVHGAIVTGDGDSNADGAGGATQFGERTEVGDVYSVAAIIAAGSNPAGSSIWYGKNGVWANSGDPAAGTAPAAGGDSGVDLAQGTYYAIASAGSPDGGLTNSFVARLRIRESQFLYPAPTGFSAPEAEA